MIISNFGFMEYVYMIIACMFLSFMDVILTAINNYMTEQYHKYEILPYIAFFYKRNSIVAIFLHLFLWALVAIYFVYGDIRIAWIAPILGFLIYRVWHNTYRIYVIRRAKNNGK